MDEGLILNLLYRYEVRLPAEGPDSGSWRESTGLTSSSSFSSWLCLLRRVWGFMAPGRSPEASGVAWSSSESERMMQGLEAETEGEGEGDAEGLRARRQGIRRGGCERQERKKKIHAADLA